MEKLLLISRESALEARLAELLGSPLLLSRLSSWSEAHRVMTRSTPAVVLVSSEMVDPSQISELVRLNNILEKENRKAFLFSNRDDSAQTAWAAMFNSITLVSLPQGAAAWKEFSAHLKSFLPAKTDAPNQASKKSSATADAKPSNGTANSSSAIEVSIRLPQVTSGKLENVPLTRLLYVVHVQKLTGILQLQSGKVQRRFAFNQGRFSNGSDGDPLDALYSAFAWPTGTFCFETRRTITGTPEAIYPLLQHGLSTHRSQRQVMEALMPLMATFPTPTQLWTARKERLSWPVLQRLLQSCDGQTSLEGLLSAMGRDVTEAFRAAIFAGDTDLLVFRGTKTPTIVEVQYDVGTSATARPQPGAKKSTPSKADRATGTERLALEKELQSFAASMKKMTPHQIFGVWEGCGREVVKETFYTLVKEHHPDVYGGNVTGEIKDLAQQIFIGIRRAYADLMKIEGPQTVRPPSEENDGIPRQPTRKQKYDTLHPGQVNSPVAAVAEKSTPVANRRTHSTPIGMSRVPTNTHPDLKTQLGEQAATAKPGRANVAHTKTSSTSTPTASRSSVVGASAKPPRRHSSVGLSESSDPEWRREQLERLERKKATRRPTPVAKEVFPPTDPALESFNRGYQLYKNTQYADALPFFEKAHNLDKTHGLYMTFYASCLFRTDASKSTTAKELLKKAIETGNRQAMPDAHLFLGTILKVEGKEERAYKHFKKTLELNPASRDAEREVRLYERRHGNGDRRKSSGAGSQGESFFKKLFKK